MSDTTTVTSDEKLCVSCGAPFGKDDDRRRKDCAACAGKNDVPPAHMVHEVKVSESVEDFEALALPDVKLGKPQKAPPRDFYWIGLTSDAPWHYVTAGGVAFQKYRGEILDDAVEGRQEFRDNAGKGSPTHSLTEAHIRRILEEVAAKVVRNYRVEDRTLRDGKVLKIIRGDVISMKTVERGGSRMRQYVVRDGDRPLGEFVYMVRVRHKNDRPMQNPPTLVARP